MGSILSSALGGQNQYQAQTPPINQINYTPGISQSYQNYLQALQGQQGMLGQEQGLSSTLQNEMNGGGPNLAQTLLNQATNQNIQQGTGQLASVKGLNTALAARLAAQNTTSANQTAAQQGAIDRQNLQLQAQSQLQNQQNLMNQNYNTQGEQALGLQGALLNANNGQNSAINEGVLGTSGINSKIDQSNAGAAQGINTLFLNNAGMLGGKTSTTPDPNNPSASSGAMVAENQGGFIPGKANVSGNSFKNDTVKALLSPGEIVIPRSYAKNAKDAKEFITELMKQKKEKKIPLSYADVLKAHHKLASEVSDLKEKMQS